MEVARDFKFFERCWWKWR